MENSIVRVLHIDDIFHLKNPGPATNIHLRVSDQQFLVKTQKMVILVDAAVAVAASNNPSA